MRKTFLRLSCLLAAVWVGLLAPALLGAWEILPDSGYLIVNQINFRDGLYSTVGEVTTQGLPNGYLNVTNAANDWVVRNLPVISGQYVNARFDLGVADGTPLSSVSLYVDFSTSPSATFSGGPVSSFTVTPSWFAAGGVEGEVRGYQLPPDLAPLIYNPLGFTTPPFLKPIFFNVQAARNQCAPAAVANSLWMLKELYGLPVPNEHKPGLKGDDTLVGALDTATNREAPSRTEGGGVWPLDGKLKYISEKNLKDRLVIKHMGDGKTGGAPNEALDGSKNLTRHGVTSYGQGKVVTPEWLIKEVLKCEDVEIDLHYCGPNDGRHYVQVVGFGWTLGVPYIVHVSDHQQTDEDPEDKLGCDRLDWEPLVGNKALVSNAVIDQAISQSVPAPATLLLVGSGLLSLLGWGRGRRRGS